MTSDAPNFRLQFLDGDSTMMLQERALSAADADDAAREAAFGDCLRVRGSVGSPVLMGGRSLRSAAFPGRVPTDKF